MSSEILFEGDVRIGCVSPTNAPSTSTVIEKFSRIKVESVDQPKGTVSFAFQNVFLALGIEIWSFWSLRWIISLSKSYQRECFQRDKERTRFGQVFEVFWVWECVVEAFGGESREFCRSEVNHFKWESWPSLSTELYEEGKVDFKLFLY